MFGFVALHGLAAGRGDGLHPELLGVLARQQPLSLPGANVADLAQHRDAGFTQAGPNPVGRIEAATAGNVVPFTRPAALPRAERRRLRSTPR